MSLNARAIALQGIGYSALLVALQGFGPAEAVETPQAAGGGGVSHHAQRTHAPRDVSRFTARRAPIEKAPTSEQTEEVGRKATEAPQPTALGTTQSQAGETVTRLVHTQEIPGPTPGPATAQPIAAKASSSLVEAIATQATIEAAPSADVSADADTKTERQRRTAIALALLMLNQ